MSTKILFLLFLLHIGVHATSSMTETVTYRVRSVAGKDRNLQDPFLTFSDDGGVVQDEFFLDIFETPIQLNNSESPSAIQTAMNFFLFSELSQIYTGINAIEAVTSEILTLTPREDQVPDPQTGANVTRMGTEARTRVFVTFEIKPSPLSTQVLIVMGQIMSDLTYFVSNLTQTLPESSSGSELSGVYEAIRREISSPPSESDSNTTDAVVDGDTSGESQITPSSDNSVASATVPVLLVVAFLVALVVFLVYRRKRGRAETVSPKNSAVMYMDVENEMCSLDRSVESSKSPTNGMISLQEDQESSVQYSMADDSELLSPAAGDSIFSDIETEYNNVRSSKSMMTGFTHASAVTIHASNLERQKKTTTPKSYAGNNSLFAFSEEVDGLYDSDRDDHNDGLLGRVPSLSQSDVSDDSEVVFHPGNERRLSNGKSHSSTSLVGTGIEQPTQQDYEAQQAQAMTSDQRSGVAPGSVSHVLADLENMESAREGSATPRDPTPTMARSIGRGGSPTKEPTPIGDATLSYNPFNCSYGIQDVIEDKQDPDVALDSQMANVVQNAIKSKIKVEQMRSQGRGLDDVYSPNHKSPAKPPCSVESINSTMPTPLLRNSNTPPAKPTSNDPQTNEDREKNIGGMSARATMLMSGIFGRSKRKSLSTPSTPTKEHNTTSPRSNNGSMSEPTTPTESKVGGHWLASSKKQKGWRPPTSPRLEGDDEYEMNLSRPSTPGEELNESLQVPDYSKEASYDRQSYSKMVDGPPNDPAAIDYHGGRRHVGDKIGGDGSAMYQTNAMHPLDWSYKSGSDARSVGESTISENDQTGMMSNQYIFKSKGGGVLRTDANLSPEADFENSKTPKSEATKESVASSRASASRQLINDLVWLENKIAGVRQSSTLGAPGIENADSLSYVSNDNDGFASAPSHDESHDGEEDPTVSTGQNNSVMSSIVCRDCFAPPGKLHIVIHSTKDGPAVHTVKEGSSLEGHIFPGDLIISVDNVDTRSFTAEQVMKMMASKGDKERKITVLHFEEED